MIAASARVAPDGEPSAITDGGWGELAGHTTLWMSLCLAGFSTRKDLPAVTSIVRALGLGPARMPPALLKCELRNVTNSSAWTRRSCRKP